jgi:hypothetical protein
MKWVLAALLVRSRSVWQTVRHRSYRSGLTVPCDGCTDPWPHDAHLASGALTFLGGRPW